MTPDQWRALAAKRGVPEGWQVDDLFAPEPVQAARQAEAPSKPKTPSRSRTTAPKWFG
jgi:hypothetical protein